MGGTAASILWKSERSKLRTTGLTRPDIELAVESNLIKDFGIF